MQAPLTEESFNPHPADLLDSLRDGLKHTELDLSLLACPREAGLPLSNLQVSRTKLLRTRSSLASVRVIKNSLSFMRPLSGKNCLGIINKKPSLQKDEEANLVTNPSVVYAVSFLRYSSESTDKLAEYAVLANQPLRTLRDLVQCPREKFLQAISGQQADKRAFAFIENTFYDDADYEPLSADYLAAASRKRSTCHPQPWFHFRSSTSNSMTEATFADTNPKLNSVYIYVHDYDCEHPFVFSDRRLLHPDDPQNRSEFPLHTFQARAALKKCRVCDLFMASHYLVDDPIVSENPCPICQGCLDVIRQLGPMSGRLIPYSECL